MAIRIAFCSNHTNPYYDAVLNGVLEEMNHHDAELLSWQGRYHFPLAAMTYLKPDALLIGAMEEEELPEQARSLPRLGFSNRFAKGVRPAVVNDDQEAGRRAVQEIASQGYQTVGLLTHNELWHARLRMRGALKEAEAQGLACHALDMTLRRPEEDETFQDVWNEQQVALRRFLGNLPLNSALVTTGHGHAMEAFHLLQEEFKRKLPEDFGIVMVDLHDQPGNQIAAVLLDGVQVGRRLVSRLVKQIAGTPDHAPDIEQIPPSGFLPGKSLRGGEVIDLYQHLKRFCTEHLTEEVNVEDLCRELGVSRRSLEQKLHHAGLPPPYELLTQIRLDRAKALLSSGDQRIEDVAEACGFSDARALRKRFQAYTGMTPREWRKSGERVQSV